MNRDQIKIVYLLVCFR